MHIRRIDTNKRNDVLKFIRFPVHLFSGVPYYCPAVEANERFSLDRRRNPFYRHSDAEFFLAESGKEVIGRIAAVHNTRHNEYRHVSTAFFHYFDVVDDRSVATSLFDAVFEWARQRKRTTILGPRGLVGSDSAGILVEGFDQRAVMGVPYNFPYYDGFIRAQGFSKLTDHLSGSLAAGTILPARILAIAAQTEERRGYRVHSFTSKQELRDWAPRVFAVHEEAFAGTHEWHPEEPVVMQQVAEGLIAVADPRYIKIVTHGEKVIGFALCYPDLSDGLRQSQGRLFPLGWWLLKRAERKSRCLVANGIGVLPSYQNLGANALLYTRLMQTLQENPRFDNIDVVQVDERNFKSLSDMATLGVRWVKIHRSYTREL